MKSSNEPYILVFGASVVDIFGFCGCTYRPCDSVPGCIKMSFGGVCRNIAENMARVGINTKLISTLGDDEKGYSMLEHAKKVGIDMEHSLILENGTTPTYMAILNEKGEMMSAIVDMDSINLMNKEFIDSKSHVIKNAEYVILDSDNPKILEYILTKYQGDTKFILDPVSASKACHIKHLIKYFHTIKPNRHEAEILTGLSINNDEDLLEARDYFLSLGIKNIFISLDEEGIFYSNGEETGRIKANEIFVSNVTGAGDSFVAGIGYGYMRGLNILDTIKYAIAMSIITIAHEETIHPEMSHQLVEKVLEAITWEEKKY